MEDQDVVNVRVTVLLPVSRSAWNANYGTGTGTREIQRDVKQYVTAGAWDHLRDLGLLVER